MSNRPAASAAACIKSIKRRFRQLLHSKTSSTSCSSLPDKIQEKKLLVLDLDETLVRHSESFAESYALSYTIEGSTYYFNFRPFVHKFLERVSQLFDVVIFTANRRIYADPVIDFLDPGGKLIGRRYYHDSGKTINGCFVKDLTILGVDLAKVVLVDNDPNNFRLQKNNGIPIVSWYFDPQDEELSTLLPFLERLAAADDVRPIIAERFTRS
ncbi:hypothetical protein MKW94_001617 [Papaver nudicaule]|uniref:FCP1 homology domain-containing protein n=1 Tax=Papaver nudicaule TaxID=74823 RepID=A0AA41SE51_PAPNU|nr:hypothetical protein [Papaver nudicaule]